MNDYPVHVLNRPEQDPFQKQESHDGGEIKIGPLWNVLRPPKALYIQGTERALELLEHLPERGLAIVGTRMPQPRSIQLVRDCIARLSGTGLIVLSGFARGVDAAAHQAALRAGLRTIAILGAGLDRLYPREHEPLRQSILASDGLIITEFPMGAPALPDQFIRRNRLIAGWAKATWVVEAGQRSGALNTARWAREHQHFCYATPCFPGDRPLMGNQQLLDEDQAFPFWGPQSLESAWLEFVGKWSRPLVSQPNLFQGSKTAGHFTSVTQAGPDEHQLAEQVSQITEKGGGARVTDLLDWAIGTSWTPDRFFFALQKALQIGLLSDEKGLVLINRSLSH